MAEGEHFLFFPVVVILGIILIILSFKLIFRLLLFFLIILALWYGLYTLGLAPSPYDVIAEYRHPDPKTPQHI